MRDFYKDIASTICDFFCSFESDCSGFYPNQGCSNHDLVIAIKKSNPIFTCKKHLSLLQWGEANLKNSLLPQQIT